MTSLAQLGANRPETIGELRDSGYRVTPVREEMRNNLVAKMRAEEVVFPQGSSALRTPSYPSLRTPSWPARTSSSWASGGRPSPDSFAVSSTCWTKLFPDCRLRD